MYKNLTDEQKKTYWKGVAITMAIGFGLWKFGAGNLMKAAGAGVIGTTAVGVATTVAGV